MKVIINKDTFSLAIEKLSSPHPFAYERVGYILGSYEKGILYLDDWLSVSDDLYEENDQVGARISREGMLWLMKKAFSLKKTFIHAHIHDFQINPVFSYIDEQSAKEVSKGLISITDVRPQGAIVIGKEFSRLKLWTNVDKGELSEVLLNFGFKRRLK